MKVYVIVALAISLSGCAVASWVANAFTSSNSNSGTQLNTNVDAQLGGERQNKLSGTDKKTEMEINATNANTTVDNSDKKQSFDNAQTNNVKNEIGLTYWFWLWLITMFMPCPIPYRKIFKFFLKDK